MAQALCAQVLPGINITVVWCLWAPGLSDGSFTILRSGFFLKPDGTHSARMFDLRRLRRSLEPYWIRENYAQLEDLLAEFPVRGLATLDRYVAALRRRCRDLAAKRSRVLDTLGPASTVLPLTHGGRGCVRFLRYRIPSFPGHSGEIEREFSEAAMRGCRLAADLIVERLPVAIPGIHRRYVLDLFGCEEPAEDVVYVDSSVGLPAAAAFLSAWLRLPLPRGIVLTGDLDGDTGRLLPVGGLREKLECLRTELKGWFHRLIYPVDTPDAPQAENNDLAPAASLKEAFDLIWGDAWRTHAFPEHVDLERALSDAEHEYRLKHTELALAAFRQIVRLCDRQRDVPTIRYKALRRLGSCLTHLGRAEEASGILEQCLAAGSALFHDGRISVEEYQRSRISHAVCLGDQYRFAEGIDVIDDVVAELRNHRSSPQAVGRALGTRALLLCHSGRYAEAEAQYRESIHDFRKEDKKSELPQDFCWLAISLGEQGRSSDALRAVSDGRECSAGIAEPANRLANEHFLRYAEFRICARISRPDLAIRLPAPSAEEYSPPLQWLAALTLRYRAECLLSLGMDEEAILHCKRSAGLFQDSYLVETLAPLAAEPQLLLSGHHARKGEFEICRGLVRSATELILKHKAARHFFEPLVENLLQAEAADLEQTVSSVLRRLPY